MDPLVITGNAVTAAFPTNGWVVGHFIREGSGHSDDLEIKLWCYDSQTDYGQKVFCGTEFIIVEEGMLRLELEVPIPDRSGVFASRTIELWGSSRDWAIIPPGCKKQVGVLKAPARGTTVRWPSAPGINKAVA